MKTKILIADDKEENLYLLQSLLNANGYEVISAENGEEALNKAIENPPDLIITDILMPVMDGFTLCKKWKAHKTLKKIPFIFYTATYTDENDVEFGLHLGADRFILKPQEPDDLLQIVTEILKNLENGNLTPPKKPQVDETIQLKEYNQALIRKLEDKINQQKEAIKIIDRSPSVAFLWKNKEGWPVEYVSKGIFSLSGYSVEDFISETVKYSDIIYPDDLSTVNEEVISYSSNTNVNSFKHSPYRIVTKNNEIKWINDISYIRRDANDIITHYEGIVNDITENILAEQKIKDQLNELQQWFNITLGREERMIELKKEVNDLLKQLGKEEKYNLEQ
ncbi:MAG: response regulator [Bacteroidota bacterium]